MPGLSFSSQSQSRGPGLWWIPIALIVVSIMLVTLCVRFDGGGPFEVARGVVQSVTKPIERACSAIPMPFSSAGSTSDNDEVAKLEQENQQLRTLVAELEEYRQQDQRLTTLAQLSDIYNLQTISAEITSTTSGWDRTATINKGSDDGIRVGMGVISSCGLYGQIESVTDTASVIRLVNDANASVSAMVQNSRAHGIMHGAYDGTLTLEYVPIDKTVGNGDIVVTSGSGGTYPRGIIVGTVSNIETDSSKLYHRITIEPIFNLESCEEVQILTGSESETASIVNEELLQSIIETSNSVKASSSEINAVARALLNSANASYKAAEKASKSSSSTSSSSVSTNSSTSTSTSLSSETGDGVE
jgi:rod shape-determining protein MreC